jgi:hypothetical protein
VSLPFSGPGGFTFFLVVNKVVRFSIKKEKEKKRKKNKKEAHL